MKVHLNQIPLDGTQHYEGEIPSSVLELKPEDGVALTPIHYSLDAGVSGDGLFAVGSLRVRLQLCCVACLQNFEKELDLPDYAAHVELTGPELVDLTPEIREDILLLLPSHPRCDADGSRECPVAFQDAPGAPLSEDPDAASSAWNALNQIKPKP